VIYEVYYAIEEWNVMGDKYEGIFVLQKISLQPLNVLFIKIVARLVQQKYIRFFQKQLCKEYLYTLSAGKLLYCFIKAYIAQTQSTAYFFNLRIDYIKIVMLQYFLYGSHILKELLQFLR